MNRSYKTLFKQIKSNVNEAKSVIIFVILIVVN